MSIREHISNSRASSQPGLLKEVRNSVRKISVWAIYAHQRWCSLLMHTVRSKATPYITSSQTVMPKAHLSPYEVLFYCNYYYYVLDYLKNKIKKNCRAAREYRIKCPGTESVGESQGLEISKGPPLHPLWINYNDLCKSWLVFPPTFS